MSAIEVIERLTTTSIINSNLKYCLVSADKHPYRVDSLPARPNVIEDFVDFEKLLDCKRLQKFAGVGISIQASNICAIDIDHCFSVPNDINSGDDRAKYFLSLFKDVAYIEFSFSGTGMRILFINPIITNYSEQYYVKNSEFNVEYYQPNNSFRYVTVTGNYIYNNSINNNIDISDKVFEFLNKYMKRKVVASSKSTATSEETRSYEELMKKVKCLYRKNDEFQELWFHLAPGSGSDESERDYHLLAELYEHITQNKEMIKEIFESSPFFKSKDKKHVYKWEYQNFRYFDYIFDKIQNTH